MGIEKDCSGCPLSSACKIDTTKKLDSLETTPQQITSSTTQPDQNNYHNDLYAENTDDFIKGTTGVILVMGTIYLLGHAYKKFKKFKYHLKHLTGA